MMLEADLLTENIPDKGKARSRETVLEGYESDSEDNFYDSSQPSSASEEDSGNVKSDEEDDMFASDDEKETTIKTKSKTLDMDQFEKDQGLDNYSLNVPEKFRDNQDQEKAQNFNHRTEDPSHGEDGFDIEVEAFDLREETESGKFDKDMNYIREKNSDNETNEDAWMSELKKEDIEKARLAQIAQSRKRNVTEVAAPSELLLLLLIAMLEPAETPMEALSRLRPPKSKRGVKDTDNSARKQKVYELTEYCEKLSNEKALALVYDMSREELMRLYKQKTGEEYEPRGVKRSVEEMEEIDATKVWEFRWIDDDAINGPFSTYEMSYWKSNYFDNKVEVRKVGTEMFTHVSEVEFELLPEQYVDTDPGNHE